MKTTKPRTLKQMIDHKATLAFRNQLFQRAKDGETITAGGYYLYTDGYTVMDRRATAADVAIVERALGMTAIEARTANLCASIAKEIKERNA